MDGHRRCGKCLGAISLKYVLSSGKSLRDKNCGFRPMGGNACVVTLRSEEQNFLKFRLSLQSTSLLSTSRNKEGCKSDQREKAGDEKVEENSKFELTRESECLKCSSRNTSGFTRKGEGSSNFWDFRLNSILSRQ